MSITQAQYDANLKEWEEAVATRDERIRNLLDELGTANAKIQELEQEKAHLKEDNRRIPGLVQGNRNARALVDTAKKLTDQKLDNLEMARRLRQAREQLEEAEKKLTEVSKEGPEVNSSVDSGARDDQDQSPLSS